MCGVSATGFTQKRHTLYAYYSGFGWEFQMLFEGGPHFLAVNIQRNAHIGVACDILF